MAAMTKGLPRKEMKIADGMIYNSCGMLDNTIIYVGGMVAIDTSGRAKPATGVTGQVIGGVAIPGPYDLDRFDNTVVGHVDNFVTAYFREGIWAMVNDGTNPVLSTTQPGTKLYAVDDQTVSVLSTGRSPAGRLIRLDPNDLLVYVEISVQINAGILGI